MTKKTTRPTVKPKAKRPKKAASKVILQKLLKRANEALDKEDWKMSLADLIRLLQWQEQTGESEQAREIEVRWVEELKSKDRE